MDKSELSSEILPAVAKSPVNSSRAAIWQNIALSIFAPLLLLGMLEGMAYLWERKQANGPYAWELVASRRLEWVKYYEPGAGYTLMQPGSHYQWQGISVDINSHGLRGPETLYAKPPGTFRILNLGDSVAMGWGIREEDTYGRQLEMLLKQQGAGALHYEVINAGVPGWNPANELAYLQAEGFKYEPDLILLDLTIVNDINGKSALLERGRPGPIEWLRAHTYFWPFLTIQMRWLQAHAQGQERIDVLDPPRSADKYFPLNPESEQWTTVWTQVMAMDRLARQNKARFVLILFPMEFQVLDKGFSTLPQEILTAKATEAGIPVLDLLPIFQEACREKPGGACQLEDRYLFADIWMHPSTYGSKLTAEELDKLVELTPSK